MSARPHPAEARAAALQAWRGMGLVLAAAVLWSTSGFFIKILTLESIPLTAVRAGIAFVALAPFARWRAVRLDRNLLVLALAFTATQLFFVISTRWTTAANAIALQSTAPVWVFLAGCLAARRVNLPLLWPILIILGGIAVMLAEPVQGTSLAGNLVGLLSGTTFATTQFFFKRVNQPAVGVVALSNLVTLAICLSIQPTILRGISIPAWEWVSLVYLGAIQIGMGMVLFTTGVDRISVGQASVLTLIEPLLNPVWVFLAIGEAPSAYGLAGFALILGGILFDLWTRLRLPPGALAVP